MSIVVRPVSNKKELQLFIYLPEKIHKNHSNWVPPIYMDEQTFFNPATNKYFKFSDTVMCLAWRGNEPVGRIMGIINHRYNELNHENHGRFCFMECFEDPEVFHELIHFVEEWAMSKGMSHLVGPLGFSDKDPQGFMIEGFNEPVVLATNANLPYMLLFVEKEGYRKKVDCVVYKLIIPEELPDFYKLIYERTILRSDVQILEFTRRSNVKPWVKPVLRLLNDTFKDIYAFVPFDEDEMEYFANRYLLLLDPKFIKIAVKNDEVVGFIIAMPDISEGIRKSRGKLFPFGILRIIASRNSAKQLNLMLGAIREDFRGKGIDVAMGVSLLNSARKRGMEYIDSHLELESNTKMRMEMEKMGGKVYKRFRIFEKELK